MCFRGDPIILSPLNFLKKSGYQLIRTTGSLCGSSESPAQAGVQLLYLRYSLIQLTSATTSAQWLALQNNSPATIPHPRFSSRYTVPLSQCPRQ